MNEKYSRSDEISEALKANDFDRARLAAVDFGRRTMFDLRTARDAETRQAIFDSSVGALTDALHLARVLRAHMRTDLNANSGHFLYQEPKSAQYRWRIDA